MLKDLPDSKGFYSLSQNFAQDADRVFQAWNATFKKNVDHTIRTPNHLQPPEDVYNEFRNQYGDKAERFVAMLGRTAYDWHGECGAKLKRETVLKYILRAMEIVDNRMPYHMRDISIFKLRSDILAYLQAAISKGKGKGQMEGFWDGYNDLDEDASQESTDMTEAETNLLRSMALASTNKNEEKVKLVYKAVTSISGATIAGAEVDEDGNEMLVMPAGARFHLVELMKVSEIFFQYKLYHSWSTGNAINRQEEFHGPSRSLRGLPIAS
jgi:hypothetical protein